MECSDDFGIRRWLRETRFLDAATSAAHFILENLRKDGQLALRDGEATILRTLEDYFLIAGLLDTKQEPKWLREAIQLNDSMNVL